MERPRKTQFAGDFFPVQYRDRSVLVHPPGDNKREGKQSRIMAGFLKISLFRGFNFPGELGYRPGTVPVNKKPLSGAESGPEKGRSGPGRKRAIPSSGMKQEHSCPHRRSKRIPWIDQTNWQWRER